MKFTSRDLADFVGQEHTSARDELEIMAIKEGYRSIIVREEQEDSLGRLWKISKVPYDVAISYIHKHKGARYVETFKRLQEYKKEGDLNKELGVTNNRHKDIMQYAREEGVALIDTLSTDDIVI